MLARGTRRGPRHPRGRVRSRQGAAVQLAVRGDRQRVEHKQCRRDQILGQRRGQPGSQRRGIHVLPGSGHHIPDQPLVTGAVLADGDRRLRHRAVGEQRGGDLAQLDADPPQFHLVVHPAEELQLTAGRPADEVAGAVHPLTRAAVRVRDEPLRGLRGPSQVPVGDLHAREVQLTGDSGGYRTQGGVEHRHTGVPHRPADRYRPRTSSGSVRHPASGAGPSPEPGHVHRCLCRPVQVVQPRMRQDPVEPVSEVGRQRLPATDRPTQPGAAGRRRLRQEFRQHRRHEVHGRDPLAVDQRCQVAGVPMPVGRRHHQRRPGEQWPEELPHRHVKTRGGLLQDPITRVEPVFVLHPAQPVDDAGMRDHDAFRSSGRTRGVDHVSRQVAAGGLRNLLGVKPRARLGVDLCAELGRVHH